MIVPAEAFHLLFATPLRKKSKGYYFSLFTKKEEASCYKLLVLCTLIPLFSLFSLFSLLKLLSSLILLAYAVKKAVKQHIRDRVD